MVFMRYTVVRRQFECMTAVLLLLVALAGAQAAFARGSTSAELELAPPIPERSGDWTYTVRPGDSLEGISSRLLGSARDQDDLVSYNNISTHQPLVPGETLKVPLDWLDRSPKPARATSVTGNVFVYPHLETERRHLRVGDRLNVGDEVRTTNGQAVIKLADGSVLQLERQSRLTFDRLTQYGRSGMADTRMNLERGRINTEVEPFEHRGSRFEIETPSAVAAVRGTQFSLESRREGTILEVREGEVWFGDGQDQKAVHAGYSAFQGADGEQSLAPLDAGPDIQTEGTSISSMPMDIRWEGSPEAGSYRVRLFDRDTGQWLISKEVRNSRINLDQLDNGEYRLNVASIGARNRHSEISTLDFVVNRQAHPAELAAPANQATVDGGTPAFRWKRQDEDAEARIEVARTAAFEDIVAASDWGRMETARLNQPLEPGQYHWRVVTRKGNASTATSDVRRFTMGGELADARIISTNSIDNRVNLYWNRVDQAQGYRLQLARDETFNDIVREMTVEKTETRVQLEPGQRYHVRVKGLATDPMTSDWGEPYEISVQ